MVVGNVPEAVDFLVAGAGPGGYEAALLAARAGRQVVLVDPLGEDGVGGACLHVGCIPSKTLIEVASLAESMRHADELGLDASESGFDFSRFQEFKSEVVERLANGVRGQLKAAGVQIRRGCLRLHEDGAAVVLDDEGCAHFLQYKSLLLATGSSPIELKALPFDHEHVLDSSDVLALKQLPKRIAVIGAGYIGLELGTALAKLGSDVVMVEMGDRVLPTMDAKLSRPIEARLQVLGVEVLTSTQAQSFVDGCLTVVSGDVPRDLDVDAVVVAVGRKANTADLGLDALDVEVDADGRLVVDADRRLRRNLAAIGDLTPGPALAHKASAEAAVAVAALCGKRVAFDTTNIPAIVFSDPEIATVGLGPDADDVVVTTLPLAAVGRAATIGESKGFAQLVADPTDGTLLGAQLVGPHASELIAQAVVAIEMGVTAEDLSLCIHPHPTLSEQFALASHRLLASLAKQES